MYRAQLPATTNAEDLQFSINLRNKRTGLSYTDTAGLTAEVEVRPMPATFNGRHDYGMWNCCGRPVLTSATLEGGAVSIDGSIISGVWRAETMRNLDPGLYAIGMVLKQDGATVQLFIGSFPVLEGFPQWA